MNKTLMIFNTRHIYGYYSGLARCLMNFNSIYVDLTFLLNHPV